MGNWWKILAFCAGFGLLVAVALTWRLYHHEREITESELRLAFGRGNYEFVVANIDRLLKKRPNSASLFVLAGESAQKLSRLETALKYYSQVSDTSPSETVKAQFGAGEVCFALGRMTPAIESFEKCLRLDPNREYALDRIISLLNTAGRRWETEPYLMALIRMRRMNLNHLLYIGLLSKEIEARTEIVRFLKSSPEDLQPNLGMARICFREGKFEEAENWLLPLINQHPEMVEAHVQLGSVWLVTSQGNLSSWNENLPALSENHPDVWYIRGAWQRQLGEASIALRFFLEAIKLDPNHIAA
ncbi:MAG TPA: tetratricopeptide repeat protein, partial [Pirellula sp.]|nr:tetratricopeptide repeat protein [Pirellula sp.]